MLDNRRKLEPEDLVEHDYWNPLQALTLAIGLFLVAVFAGQGLFALIRQRDQKFPRDGAVLRKFSIASSNARAETRLKMAATRKLNNLLSNAHEMHALDAGALGSIPLANSVTGSSKRSSLDTVTDRTLREFLLRSERKEVACGLFWTWRRILDGSLFNTEGIWINTRLIVMQAVQVILAAFVSTILFENIEEVADKTQKERDSMHPSSPQWAKDFVPTRKMVYVALYPATIVGTLVMLATILIYLPR